MKQLNKLRLYSVNFERRTDIPLSQSFIYIYNKDTPCVSRYSFLFHDTLTHNEHLNANAYYGRIEASKVLVEEKGEKGRSDDWPMS